MAKQGLDPVLLEVIRNRLETVADEMELTLLKSAASPIVKEGLDASAALFNVRGETIAQAAAIPIHLGCLELAARRIVQAFPPQAMAEGDAFLLNDPYDGGTHLPDITLAVPVVASGRVVALACTMCHHQDVGGRTPGSVPTDATEIYQEGLIIPPTRLFRGGALDENLFALLRRNVRIPEVFTGDLMAQVAAGRLGGIRLNELFGRYGTQKVDDGRDHFYSAGVSFQNGLNFSPQDTWGIGYSQMDLASGYGEKLLESYYNFQLTEKLRLSFHLTHVLDAPDVESDFGYMLPGIRFQAAF